MVGSRPLFCLVFVSGVWTSVLLHQPAIRNFQAAESHRLGIRRGIRVVPHTESCFDSGHTGWRLPADKNLHEASESCPACGCAGHCRQPAFNGASARLASWPAGRAGLLSLDNHCSRVTSNRATFEEIFNVSSTTHTS